MRPRAAALALVLAIPTLTSCDQRERDAAGVAHDTLTATPLVATESELVGNVTGMAVGDDGRLYITDFSLKHVLSITADGGDPRIMGREGSGPGEFAMPMSLTAAGDSVRVYDMSHGTVQVFSRAGSHVRSFNTGAPDGAVGRAFARDGRFAFATGGIDSTLVTLIDTDGEPVLSFGRPLVPPSTMWDFTAMKAAIREGRVPDQFRNDALPVWLDDGGVVLAFYADPEVRKYDASGDEVWTTVLTDPVLEHAFAEFVRRNTEDPNPARLFRLNYIADAFATGGAVWLLLAADDGPAVILVLDAGTGEMLRRRVVHGVSSASRFAMDAQAGRLYIASGDDASIVAVDLPEQ